MFIHESPTVVQLQQLTYGRFILFSSHVIFHFFFNQTLNSVIPALNMPWHTHEILEMHTGEKLEVVLDCLYGFWGKIHSISIYFYDER